MKHIVLAAALIGLGSTAAAAQTATSPWDGFYVGVHDGGGYGWASWDVSQVAGGVFGTYPFDRSGLSQGVFGGVQVGYGHQVGPAVLGIEANLSVGNVDGQVDCGDDGLVGYGYICNTRLGVLGTLTGRVGVVAGDTQFYVTGGAAWARHSYSITEPFYALVGSCPPCLTWGAGTDTTFGWTVGAGVEHLLSHGLSFRFDYSYVHFAQRSVTLTSPTWPDTTAMVGQSYHFISAGLNYRFGGANDMMAGAGDTGGSDWSVEFGKRAWLDVGQYQYHLFYAPAPTNEVSRLTYGPTIGVGGETFLNATSPGGYFVTAIYGTGVTGGGVLIDQDFPPYTVPESATTSDLHNGRLSYAGVDLGYNFFNGPRGSIGGFAGVTGMMERFEAFGCTQLMTSPICDPSVPSDYEIISQTSGWAGVRLGVTGEVAATAKLTVHGQAAFLPLVLFAGTDNHWLRPDANPIISYGRGFGFQLEGGIDYAVNSHLSIGVGGRYWQVWEAGASVFPPAVSVPQSAGSRHYGAFLQATYAIGQ